jgi:hypothetical protein
MDMELAIVYFVAYVSKLEFVPANTKEYYSVEPLGKAGELNSHRLAIFARLQ